MRVAQTLPLRQLNLLIDGKMVPAVGQRYFQSVNPSDGQVFAHAADATVDDMLTAIAAARRAFDHGPWPRLSFSSRGQYLVNIAKLIRAHAKELADLETRDTGKTIKQTTLIDVPTCAETFEYFGKFSSPLDDRVNLVAAPVESSTSFEPVGVVGCMIPWNYPLIMAAWKMAPALAAGNTIVFKPSSSASVSILRLAQLIQQADLPPGVVNIVSSSSHEAAAELARSPLVDMITFTGGTDTGRELMKIAAGTTKKLSLELGGKSPNIVFADCDLEAALGGAMSAIFMNQGQMCTAGSRLLLEESIYDVFLNSLIERAKKLIIGDAASYQTQFGPLVSARHRDSVLKFIEQGLKEGAVLECGGQIPLGDEFQQGAYLEPTIFSGVTRDMAIAREEIFGPVLSVMKFRSAQEAIELANDSAYGLAAMIWTKDILRAKSLAEKIQSGIVWINTYGGFYNEASFGGYKQSGFGRELGVEGLLEYTRSKHICVDQTPGGMPLVSGWF